MVWILADVKMRSCLAGDEVPQRHDANPTASRQEAASRSIGRTCEVEIGKARCQAQLQARPHCRQLPDLQARMIGMAASGDQGPAIGTVGQQVQRTIVRRQSRPRLPGVALQIAPLEGARIVVRVVRLAVAVQQARQFKDIASLK